MKKTIGLIVIMICFAVNPVLAKKFTMTFQYQDGVISVVGFEYDKALTIKNGDSKKLDQPTPALNQRIYEVRSLDKHGRIIDISYLQIRSVIMGDIGYEDSEELEGNITEIDENIITVELPFKNNVESIVIISKTDVADTNEQIELIVDIDSFLDQSALETQTLIAGDCKLRIVIVPEAYSATQAGLSQFIQEAQNIENYILSSEPFNEFASKIEFSYATNVNDLSRSNGCTASNWNRGCDKYKVMENARRVDPEVDEIIMLKDSEYEYSGFGYRVCGGGPNLRYYCWLTNYRTTNDPLVYARMALHEVNHSVIGSDDEYFSIYHPVPCPNSNCCNDRYCGSNNCSGSSCGWLTPSCTISCVKGCSRSYYCKSSPTCLMRSLSDPLCDRCKTLITNKFNNTCW